jgi:hypothetical protein
MITINLGELVSARKCDKGNEYEHVNITDLFIFFTIFFQKVIIYEVRDILDLFGNIRNSSGFVTPTGLQLNNLKMFNENRSQYHRLSKYGDSDKPRQLVCIIY